MVLLVAHWQFSLNFTLVVLWQFSERPAGGITRYTLAVLSNIYFGYSVKVFERFNCSILLTSYLSVQLVALQVAHWQFFLIFRKVSLYLNRKWLVSLKLSRPMLLNFSVGNSTYVHHRNIRRCFLTSIEHIFRMVLPLNLYYFSKCKLSVSSSNGNLPTFQLLWNPESGVVSYLPI